VHTIRGNTLKKYTIVTILCVYIWLYIYKKKNKIKRLKKNIYIYISVLHTLFFKYVHNMKIYFCMRFTAVRIGLQGKLFL